MRSFFCVIGGEEVYISVVVVIIVSFVGSVMFIDGVIKVVSGI